MNKLTFLEAVAREEGFGVQGSRPTRNNNPGDLEFGPEAERFGALRGDPRFAVFPDVATGYRALRSWFLVPAKFNEHGDLVAGYHGAKISQVIARFAPATENNVRRYIATVCAFAELDPAELLTEEILALPIVAGEEVHA